MSTRDVPLATAASQVVDPEGFAAEWEAWHRAKDARLAAEHGFLAITGLHWLTAEPQHVPDAPASGRPDPTASSSSSTRTRSSSSTAPPSGDGTSSASSRNAAASTPSGATP